jgi:hypothetical protein
MRKFFSLAGISSALLFVFFAALALPAQANFLFDAALRLEPAGVAVETEEPFTIAIVVANPSGHQIASARVHLRFDKNLLEVAEILAADRTQSNFEEGRVKIYREFRPESTEAEIELAKVSFRARPGARGVTEIKFDEDPLYSAVWTKQRGMWENLVAEKTPASIFLTLPKVAAAAEAEEEPTEKEIRAARRGIIQQIGGEPEEGRVVARVAEEKAEEIAAASKKSLSKLTSEASQERPERRTQTNPLLTIKEEAEENAAQEAEVEARKVAREVAAAKAEDRRRAIAAVQRKQERDAQIARANRLAKERAEAVAADPFRFSQIDPASQAPVAAGGGEPVVAKIAVPRELPATGAGTSLLLFSGLAVAGVLKKKN